VSAVSAWAYDVSKRWRRIACLCWCTRYEYIVHLSMCDTDCALPAHKPTPPHPTQCSSCQLHSTCPRVPTGAHGCHLVKTLCGGVLIWCYESVLLFLCMYETSSACITVLAISTYSKLSVLLASCTCSACLECEYILELCEKLSFLAARRDVAPGSAMEHASPVV
jgi:hypothetical protein